MEGDVPLGSATRVVPAGLTSGSYRPRQASSTVVRGVSVGRVRDAEAGETPKDPDAEESGSGLGGLGPPPPPGPARSGLVTWGRTPMTREGGLVTRRRLRRFPVHRCAMEGTYTRGPTA